MNSQGDKLVDRWRRPISLTLLIIALSTISFAHTTTAAKKNDKLVEYKIKAAYLYNFVRFTKWPEVDSAPNNTPIIIGILGESPFDEKAFDSVVNKVVSGKEKKLLVKNIGKFNSQSDLKKYSVIFISASEKKNIEKIIRKIGGAPILTVADTKKFTDRGGMINLVVIKKKIRWDINAAAIRNSSLIVSSQLYGSALHVVDAEE